MIALPTEKTSYCEFASLLNTYANSAGFVKHVYRNRRDFLFDQREIFTLPPLSGNPLSSSPRLPVWRHFNVDSTQKMLNVIKNRYKVSPFVGVLLAMLRCYQRETAKSEGIMSVTLHAREIPENIAQLSPKPGTILLLLLFLLLLLLTPLPLLVLLFFFFFFFFFFFLDLDSISVLDSVWVSVLVLVLLYVNQLFADFVVDLWTTIGACALLGWQRFSIVGETLSEQLQNLSRQTVGMQETALDFSCLRLLRGNAEVTRYLSELPDCTGLSLNYVVSKVEKSQNPEPVFAKLPLDEQPFNYFREYT
jgi:hypothetical protein